MDVTAQNSKVNDIWSTTDQPVQANSAQVDSGNLQTSQNIPQNNVANPSVNRLPGGGFGKPGVMTGGEGGAWGEVQNEAQDLNKNDHEAQAKQPMTEALKAQKELEILKAQELLEKARKQEAEQVAELYKPSETRKSSEVPGSVEVATSPEVSRATEVGEKLRPAEVLRPPESVPSPEVQKPQSKKAPSESPESSPKVAQQPQDIAGKVVEKRTSKEKLHRVDINKADSVTKIADIKEQDFIENVEKEHIKSIL